MAYLEDSQVMGPLYSHIDKFERQNYMLWKYNIKTLLRVRDLWSLIGGAKQKSATTNANALVAYTKRENRA
jgi:hypothetical protein